MSTDKLHTIEYQGYTFEMSPHKNHITGTVSIRIDLIINGDTIDSRFEIDFDVDPFDDVAWDEFVTELNHKFIYDTDEFDYLLDLFKLN